MPPIRGPLALPDLRRTLQEAHDYLADAARRTAPRLADARVSRWGVETKRQQMLPKHAAPQRRERSRG